MANSALQIPDAAPLPMAAPEAAPAISIRALDWPCWEAPSLLEAWHALAQCAAEPNPFYESWYLLPSLRLLDPDESVQFLMLEADGRLAGMIPIARSKRYYGRRIGHITGWTHSNCFLGAPLVAAGMEHDFWRALLEWADRNAGSALFLHLSDFPLEGTLHSSLEAVLSEQRRPSAWVFRSERAMLKSSATPEDYFVASLSGTERRELRRKLARLSEMGEVRFVRGEGSEGLEEWIADYLELEHSGWKGKGGSSLAAHDRNASVFRESISGAANHGKLERLSLTLDRRPIAMLSSFLSPPGGFGFKCAFDESYARFSPGMLLQCEHLMVLEDKNIVWFDSCASRANANVDRLWRERRPIGRISVGIGGRMRRGIFQRLLAAEVSRGSKAAAK